ncbi:FAD/NAD(P)-binding domain-containing protein [Sparassis latifolia]
MADESQQSSIPLHALLSISFLVIGGGISGLTSAIALRRAGHRVLVLEKGNGIKNTGESGIHVPANLTKVLFNWGLKDKLLQCGLVSHTMFLTKYTTGEFLGTQVWEEEVLRETRGEVLLMTHRNLVKVLYDAAISLGAKIRHNAEVVEIDAAKRQVTLASGEVLMADAIVGADGPSSLCRKAVMESRDPGKPLGISIATVQEEYVSKDLFRSDGLKNNDHVLLVAFGSRQFVMSYPMGNGKYTVHFYTADDVAVGQYGDPPSADLKKLMVNCEPRLLRMAQHAGPAVRVVIKNYTLKADWIHETGHLVVIGQAAHPWPGCTIQGSAMAVEDAAVLGKLFSHLSSEDQIPDFLSAFQDLRQPRVKQIFLNELASVFFSMLEDGDPQQVQRDEAMRAKHKSGVSVLDNLDDSPEWDELRTTFNYDCEDEADDWWLKWGRLREQARSRNPKTLGRCNELGISRIPPRRSVLRMRRYDSVQGSTLWGTICRDLRGVRHGILMCRTQ